VKCGYGEHCKFDGNVDKSVAIKVSTRYWHRDCLAEKEMKTDIINAFYKKYPNSREKSMVANKALNLYLYELNYEIEYVMFCLLNKTESLNSMYGLKFSLNNQQNYSEFKKIKAKHTKIGKYEHKNQNDSNVIEIKRKDKKGWEDYLE
jgi:hypothetical protein